MAFANEEEIDWDKLISFLKKEGRIESKNVFSANDLLIFGNLEVIPEQRIVKLNGLNVRLTYYEYEILYLLAKSPGQTFSKEQIYNHVWNMPCFGAEDNVTSIIYRIRKKIEPNPSKPIYILTVWGIGYKFNNTFNK